MIRHRLKLGVDLGNGWVKTRNFKFPARIKHTKLLDIETKPKDTYVVNYDDKDLLVGAGDEFTKRHRQVEVPYETTLFTAIGLNALKEKPFATEIEAEVCVGLPISLYMSDDDFLYKTMKDHFTGLRNTITIDGVKLKITITRFEIYAEGTYPLLINDNRRVLVIDMGSQTLIGAAFVDGSCYDYDTWTRGMQPLYAEHRGAFKLKYPHSDRDSSEFEKYFDNDTIPVNREPKDASFLKKVTKKFIEKSYIEIENRFHTDTFDAIYLTGGGGESTVSYWIDNIKDIIAVENGQMVNSQIFDLVLEV